MHRVLAHLPSPDDFSMLSLRFKPDPLTDDEQLSDNNDFCSACGGCGYLLCCDGCDRSFHFACLDPPLHEDTKELDEPWHCFICAAKRPGAAESTEKPATGLFGPLFNGLKTTNPSNFSLPEDVRTYFDGVGTDKHGNFMDVERPPTTRLVSFPAPVSCHLLLTDVSL